MVAIATYNEIENLPALLDDIHGQVPDAHVLVVDDNSPDGTGRWCQQRTAADDRLHVIHRVGERGLGRAMVEAVRFAIEQGYEFLVTMDADFSHPPRFLPDLLRGMEVEGDAAVDVMIGSRYVRGGSVTGWPLSRRWMSRAVNQCTRCLLGLSPRDCSGAFRCYRVAAFRRIDLGAVRSTGFSFLEEILWRLKLAGARMAETPIQFVNRRRGKSKIHAHEAYSTLWTLFQLGWCNWFGRHAPAAADDEGGKTTQGMMR